MTNAAPFHQVAPKPAAADPDALVRTAWFREAKYGILFDQRWRVELRALSGLGEWLMHSARISVADYAKLAGQFNPTKFDAEAWVLLAKRAGMKYIVAMPTMVSPFSFPCNPIQYRGCYAVPTRSQ